LSKLKKTHKKIEWLQNTLHIEGLVQNYCNYNMYLILYNKLQ